MDVLVCRYSYNLSDIDFDLLRRFYWIVICISEILAITQLFKFRFQESYLRAQGYPENEVQWSAGLETNSGVWVIIFLFVILLFNLLPVRIYGRVEYIFGCMKMIFLVGLILFNTIMNARKINMSRFWTYRYPYGFSTKEFIAKAHPDGSPVLRLTGSTGGLAAFWTTLATTLFSLNGMEIVLYTAPENRDLGRDETIKLATRKLSIRVILLYVLAVFTVGLNVPYDDENLRDVTLLGVPGGQNSAFVIAAIRGRVRVIPHLFNGFFIFSACSCGVNCLYAASRALHALASIRDAWPSYAVFESIRLRLERTRMGVPMNAVLASWLVTFVAFVSTDTGAGSRALGRMVQIAVVSTLIVYGLNCIAYLNFFHQMNAAASGKLDDELNLTPQTRAYYNRTARRFPYRTHLQWLRAVYAFTGCFLLVVFQGWRTLISPVAANDFLASYLAIVIFLVLTLAYFIKDRGFSPRSWRVFAVGLRGLDIVGPIVVSADSLTERCSFCGARHRRGYLRFPDTAVFTKGNFRAFVGWVWTWLK
jgi:amino acid transporter